MDREDTIIETRSLSEQVYQYLSTQIIEGAINYGETLNIKNIARGLSVSPMPVREAIKRLEMEGVVVIKPRSTCLVRTPTRKSILDALDMRELLEIHCVEKIILGKNGERIETLGKIVDQMRSIVEKEAGEQELRAYIMNDLQFHMELCRVADNGFIDKMYREISLHLSMSYIYNIAVPPDINGTYGDHMDLVLALSAFSGDAVSIIRRHLHRSRLNILGGKLFSAPAKDTAVEPASHG